MKIVFKKRFAKDLKQISYDHKLLERVKQIIAHFERVDDTGQIPNLKKLRAQGDYYRIRSGEYRIGMIIENDTVTFVRVLHRRQIYRFLP
ncbi:type II toxin-antitoxin system RelE family toxin [Desulfatitalea alkaliphila]|uniref:Type II toxin-antitoxin system RelE/ParE family toxin n=1 Tax=Desulfatitalea alkaliphila TaxID=2929485 RepID=A0AA41R1W4_9BACT|nr:type II toxin-antitoxin system RelE/ParE family toxin [Desulfatitalea alkaliphila]